MHNNITKYIKACDKCTSVKTAGDEKLYSPIPETEDMISLNQSNILNTEIKIGLEQEIKNSQLEDEKTAELITKYQQLLHKPPNKEEKKFLQKYQILNNFLYYRSKATEDWKLYVPSGSVA